MPTFFKGAGPGTHWWVNDARKTGFFSPPLTGPTHQAAVRHITAYSHPSPFVSCSTSFAVAEAYAKTGPAGLATPTHPGLVYEIDTSPSASSGLVLHDPVALIASAQPSLTKANLLRGHDGGQDLILGIASPGVHGAVLTTAPRRLGTMLTSPPLMTLDLFALIFALRDGEVLAERIPATCVVNAHQVW